MTDDLRRARIDRGPRPAQTPAGALVTHPAFVGKVTSRAGAANRTYFRVRPQAIGGPEIEGGTGTHDDVGVTDILVLPTGLPPAVGALVPVTWVRDRWVTRTTQAAGCHGRLVVSISGCAGDTELFAGATVTVTGPVPATTPVATATLVYGLHPVTATYAAYAAIEVPADGTYTIAVTGLPAGYAPLSPWTAAVAGCKDTVTGKAACNGAATLRVAYAVCGLGPGSLAGATVTVSGGGVSGTGTTDAGGVAVFPATVPADGDCTAGPIFLSGVTVTIAPPAGLGTLTYAGPWGNGRGLSRCADGDGHLLLPDDDHICLCPCQWPLPKVLTYSDPYGTAVLTYDDARGYWHGAYALDCGCVLDDPPVFCPVDAYGVSKFGRTSSSHTVPMLVVLQCVRGTVSVLKLPPTSNLPAECSPCGDAYGGGGGVRPLGYIGRTLPPPGGFLGGVSAKDVNLTCPEPGVPTLIVGTFDSKARLGWTLACFDGPFSIMP